MWTGLNTVDPRRSLLLWRIPRFMALVYSLPIWAYHAVQLRSIKLLLGWLLLLAANFAMFRYGAAIDSGRIRHRILLLPYGALVISLLLIGLYGILQH
jgi:hypothetical protein